MSEEGRQRLLKGSPSLLPPRPIVKEETEEDVVLNISLRPKKFKDFVGQKDIVDNLKICIAAALERKEPLEHILLSGHPGLGKTSLAQIIDNEMSTKIPATSGTITP